MTIQKDNTTVQYIQTVSYLVPYEHTELKNMGPRDLDQMQQNKQNRYYHIDYILGWKLQSLLYKLEVWI